MSVDFKRVTLDNIEEEHICCAISDKKGETCVASKKAWLKERMKEGLVFEKLEVRVKVFIEYLPAEYAWAPIDADGYYYIDCLWVSGQFKGQGYSNRLLEHCIAEARVKGKKGLVALSSKKKMPFLSDGAYLKHKGFVEADTAAPYYELLALPFGEGTALPRFLECAKTGEIDEKGWVLYYTAQCPHTAKYVPILTEYAGNQGIQIKAVKLETREDARQSPSPFTTYAVFYDGKFVTNEILSEKSFEKYRKKVE